MKNQQNLKIEVLSKILLIQNMLGQFSKEKQLIEFVNKGLLELPGIESSIYLPFIENNEIHKYLFDESFNVSRKGKVFGKFLIKFLDIDEIKPYLPYIQNLCFMIAVILEEKNQRKINIRYQKELENMVRERTDLLSKEIEERIKIEAQLLKEKTRAEEYLKISEAIILELDYDGNIKEINAQGCKLLNCNHKDSLLGKNWFDCFIPEDIYERIYNIFKSIMRGDIENIEYYENQIKTLNGEQRFISWHNTIKKNHKNQIIGTLSSGIDITDNKKMLESLQKTEKLEALGVLAGGIAHDFNNLLGGIFGFIDLALNDSEPGSDIQLYLKKAMSVFNRAKDLTQQLLTFSKGGTPLLKTASIAELIKNSVTFALSGSRVKCNFDFPQDLWLCDFDENQMSQVFDNLTINSIHAMPEGGELTISAKNISDIANSSSEKFVEILFIDNGKGISRNVIEKIFDPFMTTKKMGSGLGLATTYSIITKHNGFINVSSKVNIGTTFIIKLPASQQYQLQENIKNENVKDITFSGKILVMDDEEFILEILDNILVNFGFQVETVKDGESALKSIHNNENYTAIILDLTIPNGLGGNDIINSIRSKNKNIPVFASSGYFNDPVMSNPQKYGFTDCIPKPYRKKDIADILELYL